jgi:LysR family transcriptional regulator, glycine cleavage system transcriptional activator
MRSDLPPLDAIRVFAACARSASFTRAAAELGMTQGAVSQRIRLLEARLGVLLFERRPVLRLTKAGKDYASRVSPALGEIATATRQIKSAPARLRITAAPTIATRWLASRLPTFCQAHPAADVELEASTEFRSLSAFDVGIRTSVTRDWGELSAECLTPVERTPMLAPALARALALRQPGDLNRAPLIPDHAWSRWFAEAGVDGAAEAQQTGPSFEAQHLSAESARSGLGVALLSPLFFQDHLTSGELVQPFRIVLSGPDAFYAVWQKESSNALRAQFVSWLTASFRSARGISGDA